MNTRQTYGRELTHELLKTLDLAEATRRAKREQSRVFWSMIQRIFANGHERGVKKSDGALAPEVKAC